MLWCLLFVVSGLSFSFGFGCVGVVAVGLLLGIGFVCALPLWV